MLFFKAIINSTSVSTLAALRIAIFQLSTKFQTAIRVVPCCRVDRFDGYSDDLFPLELLFSPKGNLALLELVDGLMGIQAICFHLNCFSLRKTI